MDGSGNRISRSGGYRVSDELEANKVSIENLMCENEDLKKEIADLAEFNRYKEVYKKCTCGASKPSFLSSSNQEK